MDNKLVLIDLILLLYREAETCGKNTDNTELVREIVDGMKVTDVNIDVTTSADALVSLRKTVYWMLEQGIKDPYNRAELLQRIRVNVAEETYLYNVIEDGTDPLDDAVEITDAALRIVTKLNIQLHRENLKGIIKDAYTSTHFREDEVDWSAVVPEFVSQLEPFDQLLGGRRVHEDMVSEIDADDPESIAAALQKARIKSSPEGVMRLGWQGWNAMLGEVGGIRRGDQACIGALQHNFKSGLLLHIPRMIAQYNTPYMLDPKKKPLIVHISLENDAEDNTLALYKWFKENETGEKVDVRDPDFDDLAAAKYVKEKLGVNGYHFKFFRFEGTDFTYTKFIALLEDLQREYEIHMVSVDYLNLMSKQGCQGGTDSAIIRELFRRMRNYCNPRDIAFLTAHQLSSDAKNLLRMGCDNFVKEVANKGYWADCRQLDQEIDLEIIVNLERPGDGSTFLTAHRGKHRMPFITPEKDLYQVYKFAAVGGIPDDLMGESCALKKVGMGPIGMGDDGGFF